MQLRAQQHERYSYIEKSRASLAQAIGSRLGETVIRESCETHGFSLKRVAARLGESAPRLKARFLTWATPAAMCLKPFTRPRLGEPLSPERDWVSLKQKLSTWARARARVRTSSYKSRLGEAGSLGRELRVSPLFISQQSHNHIPTTT